MSDIVGTRTFLLSDNVIEGTRTHYARYSINKVSVNDSAKYYESENYIIKPSGETQYRSTLITSPVSKINKIYLSCTGTIVKYLVNSTDDYNEYMIIYSSDSGSFYNIFEVDFYSSDAYSDYSSLPDDYKDLLTSEITGQEDSKINAFVMANPKSDTTITDSSALTVPNDYFFDTEIERDDYFDLNPELLLGSSLYVVVNSVLQIYDTNSSTWNDVTSMIKGEQGETGDTPTFSVSNTNTERFNTNASLTLTKRVINNSTDYGLILNVPGPATFAPNANISIVNSTENATVTVEAASNNSYDYQFNFIIPRGETGDTISFNNSCDVNQTGFLREGNIASAELVDDGINQLKLKLDIPKADIFVVKATGINYGETPNVTTYIPSDTVNYSLGLNFGIPNSPTINSSSIVKAIEDNSAYVYLTNDTGDKDLQFNFGIPVPYINNSTFNWALGTTDLNITARGVGTKWLATNISLSNVVGNTVEISTSQLTGTGVNDSNLAAYYVISSNSSTRDYFGEITSHNASNSSVIIETKGSLPNNVQIRDFTSNTSYITHEVCINEDKIYRSKYDFTSSTDFNTAHWDRIDYPSIENFNNSYQYSINEVMSENNLVYRSKYNRLTQATFNESGEATVVFWTVEKTTEAWVANTSYVLNDEIYENSSIYKCIEAHTSGDTFDDSYWGEVSMAWEASIEYSLGDYVKNDGKFYKCIEAHTAETTFNVSYWELYSFETTENYNIGRHVFEENGGNLLLYICENTITAGDFTSFTVTTTKTNVWDKIADNTSWGAITGNISNQTDLMNTFSNYVLTNSIGNASGVVPLNSNTKIEETYLPFKKETYENTELTPTDNSVTWSITHTLGTRDCIIGIYNTTSGEEFTPNQILHVNTTTVNISWNTTSTISSGEFKCILMG